LKDQSAQKLADRICKYRAKYAKKKVGQWVTKMPNRAY
jgi:hypothetical protein